MKKVLLTLFLNACFVAITSAQLTVTPNNGNRGQSLPIIISGQNAGFNTSQGTPTVWLVRNQYSMQSGVSINDDIRYAQVQNSNTITAFLTIPGNAPTGDYALLVAAGTSTVEPAAFTVNSPGTSTLSINPNGGEPGDNLTGVTVTVNGANFNAANGISSVWLSRGREVIDLFSNIQVTTSTTFTADLSLPAGVTQGNWDVNVYTGTNQMYAGTGIFTIDENFSLSDLAGGIDMSLYPNPGSREINVEFEPQRGKDLSFRLYNARGAEAAIQRTSVNEARGQASLQVDHLPSGTYLLQMYSDGKLQGSQLWLKK